jgi:hypothetical protein
VTVIVLCRAALWFWNLHISLGYRRCHVARVFGKRLAYQSVLLWPASQCPGQLIHPLQHSTVPTRSQLDCSHTLVPWHTLVVLPLSTLSHIIQLHCCHMPPVHVPPPSIVSQINCPSAHDTHAQQCRALLVIPHLNYAASTHHTAQCVTTCHHPPHGSTPTICLHTSRYQDSRFVITTAVSPGDK